MSLQAINGHGSSPGKAGKVWAQKLLLFLLKQRTSLPCLSHICHNSQRSHVAFPQLWRRVRTFRHDVAARALQYSSSAYELVSAFSSGNTSCIPPLLLRWRHISTPILSFYLCFNTVADYCVLHLNTALILPLAIELQTLLWQLSLDYAGHDYVSGPRQVFSCEQTSERFELTWITISHHTVLDRRV